MNKPGCFAAASVFAHDSKVCQQCGVFDACSAESMKTLEAIKGLVNATDLIKRHQVARMKLDIPITVEPIEVEPQVDKIEVPVERKTQVEAVMFAITHEQQEIIKTLPVKPQEHARRLCSHNMIDKIKSELQAGRNALADTKQPRFITFAISRLLNNGFSKRELKALYVEAFTWGNSTASAHVSIICPLLTAFGIAQESNGRFVVAPALSA